MNLRGVVAVVLFSASPPPPPAGRHGIPTLGSLGISPIYLYECSNQDIWIGGKPCFTFFARDALWQFFCMRLFPHFLRLFVELNVPFLSVVGI